ncbi:MAG TPA: alpha/beta hydrolase, partial [Candidatus Lustribacter sp.]|nr:alpha/beta hydrolase [Candidatus Lustribacter sp.]
MSPSRRRAERGGLIGLGITLVAAAAGTAVGIAADRLNRDRRLAEAMDTHDSLEITPDRELLVITEDGIPLHVEVDDPEQGVDPRKKTVVMSHGYCLSSRCWVFQRRALKAAGYRVVVWDQRGHGQSGKADPSSYTIDQVGRDLAAVIHATAPTGPLLLVGHSMGGMTIMAMAQTHPQIIRERVVGLALVATSSGGIPLARGGPAAFGKMMLGRFGPGLFGELAKRQTTINTVLAVNEDLEDFVVNRLSFGSPVPRSIVRHTREMLLGTDLTVVAGFAPTFDTHDKTPAMQTFLGTETLVFNGDKDSLTPPEHSESIVRLIPGAEHIVIKDAGHIIMLEHPALLNEQLLVEQRGVLEHDDVPGVLD